MKNSPIYPNSLICGQPFPTTHCIYWVLSVKQPSLGGSQKIGTQVRPIPEEARKSQNGVRPLTAAGSAPLQPNCQKNLTGPHFRLPFPHHAFCQEGMFGS